MAASKRILGMPSMTIAFAALDSLQVSQDSQPLASIQPVCENSRKILETCFFSLFTGFHPGQAPGLDARPTRTRKTEKQIRIA